MELMDPGFNLIDYIIYLGLGELGIIFGGVAYILTLYWIGKLPSYLDWLEKGMKKS